MSKTHSYNPDTVSSIPRRDEEFSSQKSFNTVQELLDIDKDNSNQRATFYKQLAIMENGARYIVTSSDIPQSRQRDSSDIANVESNAWLTRGEGINKRRMLYLAKQAIPSIFIGAQQNLTRVGSLPRAAHDGLEIAKYIGQERGYDNGTTIGNGISQAAVRTLIETAIAEQHGIKKVYTDAIVPVFPEGLKPGKDTLTLPLMLGYEIGASLNGLTKTPLRAIRHLPRTLDVSPKAIFQQAKEIPTILAGHPAHYVSSMPRDTFGHITVYSGDVMSQAERHQRMYAPELFPNMVVSFEAGGGHASCALEDCHCKWGDRITAVADVLHDDPESRRLGGTALRKLVAERNPIFALPSDNESRFNMAI